VGVKHRTAAVAAALTLVAVVVPFASANGPMGGTEKAKLTLPADGTATVTRAPMPASSKTGTISVKEQSADDAFLDKLTTVLSNKPTFGARAVSCVLMYSALVTNETDHADYTIQDHTLQNLFLHVCIRLALDLSQQSQGASRFASGRGAAKCHIQNVALPVKITRSGSNYVATVNGASYTPKSLSARVACTHTATGMTITERARKRGAKLASVTGPTLAVGFSSTSSTPGKLNVALGVR
jgi:hypothetical protein